MEVTSYKENEDGTATVVFDMSDTEKEMLLNWAIVTAIKNGIEEGAKYAESKTDLGNT